MSNTKHTPGPWLIMGADIVHEYAHKKVGVIAVAAWVGDDDDSETNANISLIAAAPDLLYSLEELLAKVNANCVTVGDCNQAAHAIAKARGE